MEFLANSLKNVLKWTIPGVRNGRGVESGNGASLKAWQKALTLDVLLVRLVDHTEFCGSTRR